MPKFQQLHCFRVLSSGTGPGAVHTGVFQMVMTYNLYILLHFQFSDGIARNMLHVLLFIHSPPQTDSSVHSTETEWGIVNILEQNIPIKQHFKN